MMYTYIRALFLSKRRDLHERIDKIFYFVCILASVSTQAVFGLPDYQISLFDVIQAAISVTLSKNEGCS